jgi:uncharacterized membrane protein (DUF2068 family)
MLISSCPHCGSFNEESATVCYFCKMDLPKSAAPLKASGTTAPSSPARTLENRPTEYRRPGCITAYALLTLISGIVGICSALYLPSVISGDPMQLAGEYPEIRELDPQTLAFFTGFLKYYLVFFFLYSVGTLLVGWGLWTMRNWARVTIIVVQGISLAFSLFALFYSIAISGGSIIVCGVYSISLITPAWIFLWFFLNRRQFR